MGDRLGEIECLKSGRGESETVRVDVIVHEAQAGVGAGAGAGARRLICSRPCCKPPSLWGPLSSTTRVPGEGGHAASSLHFLILSNLYLSGDLVRRLTSKRYPEFGAAILEAQLEFIIYYSVIAAAVPFDSSSVRKCHNI